MYISSRTDSWASSMARNIASNDSLTEESQRNFDAEIGGTVVSIGGENMAPPRAKTKPEPFIASLSSSVPKGARPCRLRLAAAGLTATLRLVCDTAALRGTLWQ